MKPSTLSDVAELAGVSAQTVSRVINGKGGVADETKTRVIDAIAALGYRPNALARGLATRQSKTIGLIVTDFAQGFFPDTTRGIEHEAALNGYAVYIASISDDGQRIRTALDRLRDDRFAGVIVNTSTHTHESDIQQAVAEGFPVVLIHEEVPGVSSIVHWPGYRLGGEMATDHLISIGRRRIAFLGVLSDSLNNRDKFEGYRSSLERAGIPFDPDLVIRCTRDFQGGYSAVGQLMQDHPDVDGIFATSDVRAVGGLRYLNSHGISVPGAVAMVAFGASTMASMVTPSLSSIAVPRRVIGETSVRSLLDLLQGKTATPRYVHEQPMLVIGESSMPSHRPANSNVIPNGVTIDR
jgi:LacI family transcriptional regulator